MMTSDDITPPGDGSDTNGISTNEYSPDISGPDSYLTNGSLWIQAYSNDTQNIYLDIHNTTNTLFYQIWSATNLASPSTNWIPGQFRPGESGTNVTQFTDVPMTNSPTFFWGQEASAVVDVTASQPAVVYETNSTLGIAGSSEPVQFTEEFGTAGPLTIHYILGGTARNGIDYTNLSGVAIIPGGLGSSTIVYVQPIGPNTLTNPIETVIISILPNTNYLVDPSFASVAVFIKSSTTTVLVSPNGNAVRPAAPGQPAQNGDFSLQRNDDLGDYSSPLTVEYEVSGTATNGVDYQLLSGSATFVGGSSFADVPIVPFFESPLQGIKTVTLTLIATNGYIVDSNNYTTNIYIYDQTNITGVSDNGYAINQNGPPGAPVQDGAFSISRLEPNGFYPAVTIHYSMSGQASNGVDYAALSGAVSLSQGQTSTNIPIDPISSWTNVSKTVIMTLDPGYYVIDTNNSSATNIIDNSSTEVWVVDRQDATGPSSTNGAQPGWFTVYRSDARGLNPPLSVHYTLSGSATNGVDYTNLSGVITFAQDQQETNIYVEPLTNVSYPGDKTVTVTLIPETYYYIDTNFASDTMLIFDNNIMFQTVTNGLAAPVGIAYDPYRTNLIVSVSGGLRGYNFYSLGTNITSSGGNPVTNLVMTNWTQVGGLDDEVYTAIVTNSSSGFTNGDMFFGSDAGVGWLSSNATASNLSWCVLTNETETNALLLRGGLCMDPTGVFSNNIIAVTSNGDGDSNPKGVWEVDSRGNPTLLAHISGLLLEGVTVVRTNFGPWSKQIITGDEDSTSLYTVDTNGQVTTIDSTTLFPGGIHSESITTIPPNQSLYLCDFGAGLIAKLSKSYFTNYVGDLLVEEGEGAGSPSKLFIVHWDAASTNFVTRRIRYSYGSTGLEHNTFAPIEFPAN